MNKTKFASKNKSNQEWYIIDAKNKTLGRLSSHIASILRGKNCLQYSPDTGSNNHVIVINACLINISGNKNTTKLYRRHSGTPGGMKIETFEQLMTRLPNKIIEHSIKGMLPKGSLGRQLFKQLKVYTDDHHPHEAQKPHLINL